MKKFALYFACLVLLASTANALEPDDSSSDDMNDTLSVVSPDEMENRIYENKIEDAAKAQNKRTKTAKVTFHSPAAGDSIADLIARISYIEEDMRKQTGEISRLQFDLKNLSRQAGENTKTQEILQAKIDALEEKAKADAEVAAAAAQNKDESLSDASEHYVSHPGDVNSKYVVKVANTNPQEDIDAKEETDFNAGIAQISEQNLPAAQKKFTEFIKAYPDSAQTSEAYFWLGEIGMEQAQYKDAALNYLKSYKADKHGKRAEEALLKSSTALGKLGKKDEACKNLTTLQNVEGLQDLIKEQASSESIKLGCK